MTSWIDRLMNPFRGVAEAKEHLERSRADQEKVGELTDDLMRLEKENHITRKIHAAFRGDAL